MYSPETQAEDIADKIDELKGKTDLQGTIWGEDALDRIVQLAKRGKMVRGSLLIEACEAMDAEPDYNCAAAVELTHTALLIHDDIIDEDKKRRGQDTIYVQYSESFDDIDEREAESLAICAGDICFFLAYRALSTDSRISSLFSEILMKVGAGQMRDIESSSRHGLLGVDEVLDFYRNKTASYSFVLPLQLASIIGRGEKSDRLEEIGHLLGELFQIKDDALDFAPEDRSGKPSLSDLEEGKNTIYTAKLRNKIGEETLQRKLGAGKTEVRELRNMIVEEGIDKEVEEIMRSKKREIDKETQKLENKELQVLIQELAEFIVEREK